MKLSILDAIAILAMALPGLVILAILLHSSLRRARWKRNKRKGLPNTGFCPSATALGAVFLLTHTFVRPSLRHVIEARLQEDSDEDDNRDPDTPEKWLHLQLRCIRRGEPVDTLVLRL